MNLKKCCLCLLSTTVILLSCVDKDDPSAELPSGNWVLSGMNYSSNAVFKPGPNVHFTAGATDGVWGLFNAQPTTLIPSYKIVMGPAASLAVNEMVLQIDRGAGDAWYSTGTGTGMATVARDGLGNIRITVPSVTVRHYLNGVIQNDSTTGSCVLIYK